MVEEMTRLYTLLDQSYMVQLLITFLEAVCILQGVYTQNTNNCESIFKSIKLFEGRAKQAWISLRQFGTNQIERSLFFGQIE